MRFIINKVRDEYHLLCSTGKIKYFNENTLRTFLMNYNPSDFPSSTENQFADYEGVSVLTLDNNGQTIIHSPEFLHALMYPNEFPYYTATEFAELHNRQKPIVLRNCRNNKIPGAVYVGNAWFIPKTASYPKDGRAGRDMSARDYKSEKK